MLIKAAEDKEKVVLTCAEATIPVKEIENGDDGNDTGGAILKYLHRVGSASPRDIQHALDLPKTSAFRQLDRLMDAGTIIRTGKTAAIRYSLKPVAKVDGAI